MDDQGNERGGAAVTELTGLATWLAGQLHDPAVSREDIAEQAADRIRALALWLRGAAKPGDYPAAEEVRLAEAERVVMEALGGDPARMPPSVLLRAHQELLRQSRWLVGVMAGDPRLAQTTLRLRAEDKRAPLVAALLEELPRTADDWEKAVAAGLAEYDDSTCELVTSWLRQARADAAAGTETVHRRILDEAIAAYARSVREAEDRGDGSGT